MSSSSPYQIAPGCQDNPQAAPSTPALDASSEAQIKAILDNSPALISLKDPDGRFILVNREFQRVYGLCAEEVAGTTVLDLYTSERAHAATVHDQRTLEDCVASEREAAVTVNGEERIYSVSKFPVLGTGGEVVAVGSICTDISERKAIETELKENRRVLATLMSNLPGMAYRVSVDGECVVDFVSEGCLQLTGFAPEEVIGRRDGFLVDLAHPDDRDAMNGYARRCMENREPFKLTYRIITASGEEKWVWEQGRGIYGADGKLRSVEGFVSDVSEARALSEKLTHQASYDALTGLINRRAFEERLTRVLESSRNSSHEHALCYLDLDQFKVINDTCGHVAGDALLRQLGEVLRQRIRKRDTLARLGGDEFGLLMEHCSLEDAGRAANLLRETIEEFRFVWEGRCFVIGASMGLVALNASSVSVSEALSAVDAACYVAKERGRNRIHINRPDDMELMQRQGEMRWVGRINDALSQNKFRLNFQPIVPIEGCSEGAHYELLLRMIGDDGESIPPGAFLPAAERYNLAPKLDRWTLSRALDWLGEHPDYVDNLHLCAINLSGHTLADPGFMDFAVERFDESGIPPEKFCFEVTETAAIANLADATRLIHALRERGCVFALDDFGSGLSSFAYLKTLPVDFLKIDGLFVKDIVEDPIDFAMVRSIHEIGQVMGKKTIAEFVESDAILERLREIGVDYAQGYGIGRPLPLEEYPGPGWGR